MPNITAMMPLVGATVDSQSSPITAPNRIDVTGVTGKEMKASTAAARENR